MDPKIQELLAELERERRRRQDAEDEAGSERTRCEEEQRRREEAEALASSTGPSNTVSWRPEIVTDPTLTTQDTGNQTNKSKSSISHHVMGHIYRGANEGVTQAQSAFHFLMKKLFPSLHQLSYVCQIISSISSE
ncbi:hypothetical protein AJ78_02878 [Emergomyces pasteurianus Ep9510]|uniref:Uncharacterized protein n=1 Tax=Emergomyces pasteurianus Ep9510 TaxID=1447872 RepID=A0A1J9QP05_9EURO|nr:hypothetical protein AJ78_02878 [Emergomyces pasteurianus Ep9510]